MQIVVCEEGHYEEKISNNDIGFMYISFNIFFTGFVNEMIADSSYKSIVESKKYTEVGIGYYSNATGSYMTWVIIPISK